ncbi:MAG: SMP-30/gluconolactonase/LRE family protein [Desulfobacterales bacterium]|nr:SMP-30/gluconolactonase/LRE family protein [Desulfobacterales bacterium]
MRLWFLDIWDQSIKKVSVNGALETGFEVTLFPPNCCRISAPDDGMVFGDALKRQMLIWNGKEYKHLADISNLLPKYALSDGIADAQGRIYMLVTLVIT